MLWNLRFVKNISRKYLDYRKNYKYCIAKRNKAIPICLRVYCNWNNIICLRSVRTSRKGNEHICTQTHPINIYTNMKIQKAHNQKIYWEAIQTKAFFNPQILCIFKRQNEMNELLPKKFRWIWSTALNNYLYQISFWTVCLNNKLRRK